MPVAMCALTLARSCNQTRFGVPIFGANRKRGFTALLSVYHAAVSSIGLTGFSSLMMTAAKSRNTGQFCGFFVRAPFFGGSNGEPQGSPVNQLRCRPGLLTRSSCLPRLAAGVAVVQDDNWSPNMAKSTATTHVATSAFSPVFEYLDGVQSDADRALLALSAVMELLQGCAPDHQLGAGGLHYLLEPIWGSLDTLCGDLRTMNKPDFFN